MTQLDFALDDKVYVVHKKKQPYDVDIGRGTKWGNPYVVGVHGTRDECCDMHQRDVLSNPELMDEIRRELKGKVLGCWCRPTYRCHGDLLARIANGEDNGGE